MVEVRNRNGGAVLGIGLIDLVGALGLFAMLTGVEGIKGSRVVFEALFAAVFAVCTVAVGYLIRTWGSYSFQEGRLSVKGIFPRTVVVSKSTLGNSLYWMRVVCGRNKVIVPRKRIMLPILEQIYPAAYSGVRTTNLKLPIKIRKRYGPTITLLAVTVCSLALLALVVWFFSHTASLTSVQLSLYVLIFALAAVTSFGVVLTQVAEVSIDEKEIFVRYKIVGRAKAIPRERVRSTELFVHPGFLRLVLVLNIRSNQKPNKIVFTDDDHTAGLTLYDLRAMFDRSK